MNPTYDAERAIIAAAWIDPALFAELDRKYHRPSAISQMNDEEFAALAFRLVGRRVQIRRPNHG
jgi:hypothetical protein